MVRICQSCRSARIFTSAFNPSFIRCSHTDATVKALLNDAFKRLQHSTAEPEDTPEKSRLHLPASSFLREFRQMGTQKAVESSDHPAAAAASSAIGRARLDSKFMLDKLNSLIDDVENRPPATSREPSNASTSTESNAMTSFLELSPRPKHVEIASSPASSSTQNAETQNPNAVSPRVLSKAALKRQRRKATEARAAEAAIVKQQRELAAARSISGKKQPDYRVEKREIHLEDTSPKKPEVVGFRSGWKSVKWTTDDWGTDGLAPPSEELRKMSPDASRRRHSDFSGSELPSYNRRIEGLILPMGEKEIVLQDVHPPLGSPPIATLAHGLDRVLFNPGVHWLQDPRSRVYNFTPALQALPDVQEFAFERLGEYITSSRDEDLYTLATTHNKRFAGSTSSLTGLLSHIYFLLSNDHEVDTSILSRSFYSEPKNFTPGQRMPVGLAFRYRNGVYAIDSKSPEDVQEKNILTWMGTMLEKLLTLPTEDFKALMRSSPEAAGFQNPEQKKEPYRYSKTSTFVMRSQLDCRDPRLPGTGVFDIKTRAALPIRLDGLNYKENSGYQIRTQYGPLESFEKEYYDLIRSAFLKYSFQARIGNMDGIFLAYHNTARLFGFQYVPLEDMEDRIYGSKSRGDRVFHKCVGLLERVVEEVVACFPDKSVSVLAETPEGRGTMHLYIQPLESVDGDGTKPIMQLNVTAASFLGEDRVSGNRAVDGDGQPWTLHWSISRSSLPQKQLQANLNAVHERLFRAYNLPSGTSTDEMVKLWGTLNYGADPSLIATSDASPVDGSRLFKNPSRNVEKLRLLAREGQLEVERWAEIDKNAPKIVWGQPDYVESDIESVAASEAEESENDVGDLHVPFASTFAAFSSGSVRDEFASESNEIEPLSDGSHVVSTPKRIVRKGAKKKSREMPPSGVVGHISSIPQSSESVPEILLHDSVIQSEQRDLMVGPSATATLSSSPSSLELGFDTHTKYAEANLESITTGEGKTAETDLVLASPLASVIPESQLSLVSGAEDLSDSMHLEPFDAETTKDSLASSSNVRTSLDVIDVTLQPGLVETVEEADVPIEPTITSRQTSTALSVETHPRESVAPPRSSGTHEAQEIPDGTMHSSLLSSNSNMEHRQGRLEEQATLGYINIQESAHDSITSMESEVVTSPDTLEHPGHMPDGASATEEAPKRQV